MLDIKLLRQDLDAVAANLARRGFALDRDKWTRLETQRKDLQVEVERLRQGYRKPAVAVEPGFRNSSLQRDEAMDLVLRLVKEIVHKNRGIIRFDIDEKKTRTFISLVFPVERRKIVYYPKPGA